jgi:hypothetical protein
MRRPSALSGVNFSDETSRSFTIATNGAPARSDSANGRPATMSMPSAWKKRGLALMKVAVLPSLSGCGEERIAPKGAGGEPQIVQHD